MKWTFFGICELIFYSGWLLGSAWFLMSAGRNRAPKQEPFRRSARQGCRAHRSRQIAMAPAERPITRSLVSTGGVPVAGPISSGRAEARYLSSPGSRL
jgi:hypothetical protein